MSETKIKCTENGCEKAFCNLSAMNRHVREIHLDDKPFVCPVENCGKKYVIQAKLDRHLKVHTGEKNYECDICGEKFARKDTLQVHMRIHNGDKPYQCNGCEEKFAHLATLLNHQRIHTGESPYVCEAENCGRTFKQRQQLVAHTRYAHTFEKPYPCDLCDMKFATASALNEHRRVHTGEKPYKCDFKDCCWSFATSYSLTRHKLWHTGETPVKCDEEGCTESFQRSEQLKVHKFFFHTEEGQQKKRKEEERIAKLFDKHEIHYKRSHHVDFNCTDENNTKKRCFIDFIIEAQDKVTKRPYIVFLEVDEHQHEHYGISCETKRMLDAYESLIVGGNTLPIVFIRYNPHEFTVDNVKRKVTKQLREQKLLEVLNNLCTTDMTSFNTIYMFYNSLDGIPYIFSDPAYPEEIKNCMQLCI